MSNHALFVVVLLPLATACSEITGVGEYRVGPTSDDAGDRRVANGCGSDEVLTDDGACERVGVPPVVCDAEFTQDVDGACHAVMPDADCEDGVAFPGSVGCADPPVCDDEGYPPLAGPSHGPVTYVNAQAPTDCAERGTRSCPYAKIGEALAATEGVTDPVILLHEDRFEEDVVILTSGLTLQGCGSAEIHGVASPLASENDPCQPIPVGGFGARPAVCVPPSVTRVVIQGLKVTGQRVGVWVNGGGLELISSQISDTLFYGLAVHEAQTSLQDTQPIPGHADLRNVAILRASGVGIHVVGSTLTMDRSSIQATRMINEAPEDVAATPEERLGLSRGIAIYPSRWPMSAEATPEDFALSDVRIERSAITGNVEVGVFATGATVNITRSFIGALPDGAPAGRGLVLEQSIAVGAPASATVEESVFERTRDTAIEVRDATLTMQRTTIRDTLGRLGDGCTGQGIRVRTLPPGDGRSVVTVESSSILKSRQAAVFAASSTVTLRSSLLRDIAPDTDAPCAAVMGDGIDIEDYPDEPGAEVELDRVRIEGASRAAVAVGSPGVNITSSVLACSGLGLVEASGRERASASGAICGCGEDWERCTNEPRALASWAVAGASPAWPDRTGSFFVCLREAFVDPSRPLPGFSAWAFGQPEIVPARTGPGDGCAMVNGLGPGLALVTVAKSGYSSSTRDAYVTSGVTRNVQQPSPNANLALLGWPIGEGVIAILTAPEGSDIEVDPPGYRLGPNAQPIDRGPVSAGQPWFYEAVGGSGGGWYTLTITPPEGYQCIDEADLGTHPPGQPNVRYTRVEEGRFHQVAFGNCILGPG